MVENPSRVSSGKSRQRGPQCGLGGGMPVNHGLGGRIVNHEEGLQGIPQGWDMNSSSQPDW